MAKEATIRQKAIKLLKADGWTTWCPVKPRFNFQETDILGVYDCIAVRGRGEIRFIQWTSKSNMRARVRKIEDFFRSESVFIPNSEVWGYDDKAREFRIIPIAPVA